jgi:hypothetical protein
MRSKQEGFWKPGVLFSFWMYPRLPSSVSISRSVCNFTSTGTVIHEFRVSDCKWSSARRELRGKVYNCEASETLQEIWAANFLLMIHRELFEELEKISCCYEVHNWGLGFRCRGWISKLSMLLSEYMNSVAEIGQQF